MNHRILNRAAIVSSSFAAAALVFSCIFLNSPEARADDTIKRPGDHPKYRFEGEPHLIVGFNGIYESAVGLGFGARFSIPIVENGFVPSINNSVAISFGADLLHYDGCSYKGSGCKANILFAPVAMQWNFFVAQRWSVFGEPGIYLYHGFFNSYCEGIKGCSEPTASGLRPALFLGGRYYFNEHISLTMRIGFPHSSVGVSFM